MECCKIFVLLSPFSQGRVAYADQFVVCVRVCVWNWLPGGRVTALVSNVIILKCVLGNYHALAHSSFMHTVLYLAL